MFANLQAIPNLFLRPLTLARACSAKLLKGLGEQILQYLAGLARFVLPGVKQHVR